MHRVSHAGLIGGAAGLDAADSVCLLLAETAGKQPREVDGKAYDHSSHGDKEPGTSNGWPRGRARLWCMDLCMALHMKCGHDLD